MQPKIEPVEEKPVVGKIRTLCGELDQNGIVYCHWKSNAALERSTSGENDLDLLISRSHIPKFTAILYRLGFRQACEPTGHQLPGVLDYYGYDEDVDRLIHVHVHCQLILGHDATKNYHIPIEEAYLSSSTKDGLFMVPSPEYELIILVIRLILKHCTWDTILLGQRKLTQSERFELDYLINRASETQLQSILEAQFKFLDLELWKACLNILVSTTPVWEQAWLGQKLLKCLAPFARRPQMVDAVLKIWRRFAWPFERRILHKDQRKQFNNGGLMVAIIGGDGAGKTTIVETTQQWLADDFEIHRFHMGKPKWSKLTILIRGLIKIGRSLGFYPFMKAEIQYTHDTASLVFPGYPWLIREICTARDRYLTYVRAQRIATNGGVVILDRFPISQIQFMDGPQVAWMTTALPSSRLLKFLIHLEESYYQKMMMPDLLILLRVDPEIAVNRKTDEDQYSVRARSTEIWELDWSQTPAHVIDASRTKQEVINTVKKLIWERL